MPLRKKLLIAMFIPALLLCIVGIVGIYSVHHLKQAAGRILSDNYHSIQEARRMERELRKFEVLALGIQTKATQDNSHTDRLRSIDEALSRCQRNITEEGERAVLDRIRRTWQTMKYRLLQKKSSPSVDALRTNQFAFISLYAGIDELIELNEQGMDSYEHQTRHIANLMIAGVTGSLLVAMLALALLALISANRIAKPVVEVADRLHLALNPSGQEDIQSKETALDEIVRLREELDDLLRRLARYDDEQNKKLMHMQGRLAFVINEVLEGLALFDDKFQILAVNRVARQILGLQHGGGNHVSELHPGSDVQNILDLLMQGEFFPARDLGEIHCSVDAQDRVYRPRVLTVTKADGAVEGYLLLFWDVTEQSRFDESRRRFISMLSHQLKTPMTSLAMSVNLLSEKIAPMDPVQTELLSIATQNCSALSNLICSLIEAARDVAPDLSVRLQRIDLIRLLRSALRPLLPQAQKMGINLLLPREEQSVFVSVDPVKFPWVVTNIAGNALRYTKKGGTIEIGLDVKEDAVKVQVADTGEGIANDDVVHIFDPFVSLDSQPQAGTHGLGLAIAKEIVEAHKGTINAESEIGKGTTFTILLPIAKGEK